MPEQVVKDDFLRQGSCCEIKVFDISCFYVLICTVLAGRELHRLCTLNALLLESCSDTHQGFDLALQRRDALGLRTLLINENQSVPVETLCTVVVVLGSRYEIQDTLSGRAIVVVT